MSTIPNIVPFASKIIHRKIRLNQLFNLTRNIISLNSEYKIGQPTHISIFVTDRCNFKCHMCPTHSPKIPEDYKYRHKKASDMSLDLFRYIMEKFPEAIRVWLVGTGEPLLNKYFYDLVKLSLANKKIVSTVTNGYLLDNHMPEILKIGLERICISVNGHTSKEFNRMTGNPEKYFFKILENVNKLVKLRNKLNSKLVIEVSFIIDNLNFNRMKDMIELTENIGVDTVDFLHFLPSKHPGFMPEERCLFYDNVVQKDELMRLISKKYQCNISWPYLLKYTDKKRSICRWPFRLIQVDGNGNVGGCGVALLNMDGNGKVFDNDPWNNDYFINLRRSHINGELFWPCRYCGETFGIYPKS